MKEYEEKVLAAAINDYYTPHQVICPFCKLNPVFENKGILFCKCGFRLNVQSEALSLSYFHSKMVETMQYHW